MMPVTKAFVQVYRAANSTEAHLLKGLLEQYGMPVRMFGEGLAGGLGELPADVMQVDIEVPVGYRQYARELIEEYENHGVASVAWICVRCAESNPPSFDICWNCGTLPGKGDVTRG
ncbi:MAG: DUF2007 domain-containing protein [Gammaproteobacteria bacterium]|nr:MAG: DUF2007 domain-containing protein [Gammaproteobacteria bacterium]